MDKLINNFSSGLFLWQLFMIVLSVLLIVFLVRLGRKMQRYYTQKK
jgi:hypothetical protein